MKAHQSIIVIALSCLLLLASACGKKSVRSVSGGQDLFSSQGNHEVTGHDKALYGDSLVRLGETPLKDGGDAWVDGTGVTMGVGREQGLANDGSLPGDPLVQFEESSLADGRDAGAVEALSASDLYDEKGETVFAKGGGKGSSGGALGMENNNGTSQALTKDQLAASGPSSGTSAAQGRARRTGARVSQGLRDVYFAYDSWRLSEQSHRILESNAQWLKAHPHGRLTIEGHCDERGTQAYNYILGERRAETVKQYLSHVGVPSHQMEVVSFGKDRPTCHVFSTGCFQSNRRAHFSIDVNTASRD